MKFIHSWSTALLLFHALTVIGRALNDIAPAPTPAPVLISGNEKVTTTWIWSTTSTSCTRYYWDPAPSIVTFLSHITITTLREGAALTAAYPVTVDETYHQTVTYEYRLGYKDGHRSTSWGSEKFTWSATAVVEGPTAQVVPPWPTETATATTRLPCGFGFADD